LGLAFSSSKHIRKFVKVMAKETKQKIKINRLLEDLESGNDTKFNAAIKALQVHGDIATIEPLVQLLLNDNLTPSNRSALIELLSTLNLSDAPDEIMRIVKDDNYLNVRPILLSSIWNSKLDYSYFLSDFVEIAVEGDYLDTLECLTIIENLEGPFEERHILEAQLFLRDFIESEGKIKDDRKAVLISEIAILLKDFDLDDDIEMYE
jgi:hypothetical protein